VQLGNQYIDKTAPWVLAKQSEHESRLDTVLYHSAETLRCLCISIYAFMPTTAEEIKQQLGLTLNFTKPILEGEFNWGGLLPGTQVTKGQPIFPRIEATTKSQGKNQPSPNHLGSSPSHRSQATASSQMKPEPTRRPGNTPGSDDSITIQEFQKIQLKAAKVLSAERVPKSEKLVKLQVDLGGEQRQIVAGIGKKYKPENLVGQTVVVVANLKPAKLMGIESQGMVLAAGDEEVKSLATFLEEVDPGTKVK
ncbi:MAG: methionine--tRNA ligase subunit beta, partial [Nitrospirales bacterium]